MTSLNPSLSRAETQRRRGAWEWEDAEDIAGLNLSRLRDTSFVSLVPKEQGSLCGLCVSARGTGTFRLKRYWGAGVLVVLGLLGAMWVGPLLAGEMVHGENSEFAGHGVAMAWAILKAPVEEQSQVVVRIVRLEPSYASLSIEGVDPFDQRRQEVLGRTTMGEVFETRVARGTFAEFTRREFHFYTAQDEQARVPSLTVYYMGVPDTAPEFLAESALSAYLTDALRKVQGGEGGRRP